MACGRAHTVVSTSDGRVFSFGSNADGQLGAGRTLEFSDRPLEVESLRGEEVAAVAAGSAHAMAVNRKGDKVR